MHSPSPTLTREMAKFHVNAITLVFVVAGVAFGAAQHKNIAPPAAKPRVLDPRLQHLGSIEGKAYYMENSRTVL